MTKSWLPVIATALVLQALGATSVVVPSSNCYVLDNSSHIVDFSSWVGHSFEYEQKDPKGSDLVVQFCKDVESRSQTGYVDFGRFDKFNYFVTGSGQVDFVQGFFNGDLVNCESSHDKMGRTAQMSLDAYAMLPMNQLAEFLLNLLFYVRDRVHGYLRASPLVFIHDHGKFFATEQVHVALYMTAIASLSKLVQKPIIEVLPENGLEVRLSGSGATGKPPTTLSPTVLIVDWRCEKARDTPYEVNVTIPVEGYEPIQFILTKMCEYRQDQGAGATRGWATFGVLSSIFFVFSTVFCCGGFLYKTRVQRVYGIDALPGMTILSACLETVSGAGQSYSRAEDLNSAFANASWERPSVSAQGASRPGEKKYGSI